MSARSFAFGIRIRFPIFNVGIDPFRHAANAALRLIPKILAASLTDTVSFSVVTI
jgi:hypothetical protein